MRTEEILYFKSLREALEEYDSDPREKNLFIRTRDCEETIYTRIQDDGVISYYFFVPLSARVFDELADEAEAADEAELADSHSSDSHITNDSAANTRITLEDLMNTDVDLDTFMEVIDHLDPEEINNYTFE